MLQEYRFLCALAFSVMPHRDLLEVLDLLLESDIDMPDMLRRTILADVEYRVQVEIEIGKQRAAATHRSTADAGSGS